jgi:DNA-binding response OmpR family regulator
MNDTTPVVLLIDDDLQIRRFLRAGFNLEHFKVLEEETGEAGLRSATLRSVDLIIVDLNLPDMDGAEIVKRIRAWSIAVVKPFSMVELLARARAAPRSHCAERIGCQSRKAFSRSGQSSCLCRHRANSTFAKGIPIGTGARTTCRQRGHPQPPGKGDLGRSRHAKCALFANLGAQAAPQD